MRIASSPRRVECDRLTLVLASRAARVFYAPRVYWIAINVCLSRKTYQREANSTSRLFVSTTRVPSGAAKCTVSGLACVHSRACPGSDRIRYLVDPASSHMLVSKTKPCKSKYKHLIRRNCRWLIKTVIVYLMVNFYLDNRRKSRANTCTKAQLTASRVY